jgi:hypothetical protein
MSSKSVLSLYILSLKQLLFRSLKSVLSLFTLLLKHLLFRLLNSKSVLSQLRILSFKHKWFKQLLCEWKDINSDNTDLVDLNNKCLNGGFNSDHIDIGDLNNKCLNESIFNNDKTGIVL